MYKGFKKGLIGYLLMFIALVISLFVSFRFMSLTLILFGAVVSVLVQTNKSSELNEGEEK